MSFLKNALRTRHAHIIYGALITGLGYLTTHLNHVDISESIDKYLPFLTEHDIEEVVFWSGIFIIFLLVYFLESKRREQKKELKEVHSSMLYASNHIIRNFLYQAQLIRMEAEASVDFDKEVLELFDNSISEAELLLQKVSEVTTLNNETIHNSLYVTKEDFIKKTSVKLTKSRNYLYQHDQKEMLTA